MGLKLRTRLSLIETLVQCLENAGVKTADVLFLKFNDKGSRSDRHFNKYTIKLMMGEIFLIVYSFWLDRKNKGLL